VGQEGCARRLPRWRPRVRAACPGPELGGRPCACELSHEPHSRPCPRRPRFAGERHYRTKAIGYVRSIDTVNKLWNETGPRYA
jgi:hypothetical protein